MYRVIEPDGNVAATDGVLDDVLKSKADALGAKIVDTDNIQVYPEP